MTNILQVENLKHCYTSRRRVVDVFDKLNLIVPPGKMVAVTGESGCGKTTLLLDCGAMQRPTSGKVQIVGDDILGMGPAARANFRAEKIGYVFQTLELVPYLNLIDNLRMVRGVSAREACVWLERLGLGERKYHKPESLSHGQRQRAALARAIAHQPRLVIADEPTGNLDNKNSALVFQTLREFADKGGGVLVATHDPTIESFADEIHKLEAGRPRHEI